MEPFTKAEFEASLKLRKVLEIPKELKRRQVVIFHCIIDAVFLDQWDVASILYDHPASRPSTFMFDHIVKYMDPLKAALLRHDREAVLVMLKNLYEKFDLVLTNSKFQQGNLKKYFDIKAHVVYPPVNLDMFHVSNPPPASRTFFLSAQRVHWQKRIETQIAAFKGINAKLKIVGGEIEGVPDKCLTQLARGCSNIEILGRVSDERLVSLFQSAKAIIQTGWFEDFGLVPVEAMACGTPVICVDEGGFKETVHSPELGMRIQRPYIENLRNAVHGFDSKRYDSMLLREEAEKYGLHRFNEEMKNYIQLAIEKHREKHVV